jgi:hypothetical protein
MKQYINREVSVFENVKKREKAYSGKIIKVIDDDFLIIDDSGKISRAYCTLCQIHPKTEPEYKTWIERIFG